MTTGWTRPVNCWRNSINTADAAVAAAPYPTVGVASGKLILAGEHSVVYGRPAIALPFPRLEARARISTIDGPSRVSSAYYEGTLDAVPEILNGMVDCIRATLAAVGHPRDHCMIQVESSIPTGRGLGSSAAVAAAAVRGIAAFYGAILSHEDEMDLVRIAEVHAHGTPSGIDAEAVVATGAFRFLKGQPAMPLAVGRDVHLVVADSGFKGDTRAAVAGVRARFESSRADTEDHLDRLSLLAERVGEALGTGETATLGAAMTAAQDELSAIGVSDAHLDMLIGAAQRAGAIGAKITGSGLGGCIVALAPDPGSAETVSKALLAAGAQATWPVVVHERKVSIPG